MWPAYLGIGVEVVQILYWIGVICLLVILVLQGRKRNRKDESRLPGPTNVENERGHNEVS